MSDAPAPNIRFPVEFVLAEEQHGARLDQLVQARLGISRRLARLCIAQGRVRVGRQTCRILTRPLKAGQRICILAADAGEARDGQGSARTLSAPPVPAATLRILYIDKAIVAVDKPAGLLSEQDRFAAPSVQSLLPALLRARQEREALWLVHRLDAGTSGVLILARTPAAARYLYEAFRQRTVEKIYWALSQGTLAQPRQIDAPLGRVRGTQQGVLADGKPAQTAVRPLMHTPHGTLVEARPRTGRSHQIRVHLAHIGHAILGDGLYKGPRYVHVPPAAPQPVLRPMLHARQISFAHPAQPHQKITLSAAAPADFCATAHCCGLRLPEEK